MTLSYSTNLPKPFLCNYDRPTSTLFKTAREFKREIRKIPGQVVLDEQKRGKKLDLKKPKAVRVRKKKEI